MWPTLLNLTRDDCRRTLRRLELEAYSNMIDVFRAQGALEDNRKKILEELRAVLHISNDRHSAEARRVANDELLATIAEQLAGPNTGLGWICEGRRRIPLMPRGIPQTMYTEIADKAAEAFAAENKERLEKLSENNQEDTNDDDMEIDEMVESPVKEEIQYPPVAMEDQAIKVWEAEQLSRKRKVPETGSIPDDSPPPVKNVRNITPNTSQKYLNLSQLYSKFSQPATSKPSSQSKHSYNQVSKVSTRKSNPGQPQKRATAKQRVPRQKHPAKIVVSKAQMKKAARKELVTSSPSKQFPASIKLEYNAPPNSFQASYAQSLIGGCKEEQLPDPGTAPAGAPAPPELSAPPDPAPHPAQHTAPPPPIKHAASGKPCQLIIKKRGDHIPADKKIQMTDVKILQKPNENIKVLSNRPVVLTNSAHKHLSTPTKLVTTKVIGPVGKPHHTPVSLTDKMIVVSKPPEQSIANSKIVMSSAISTPSSTVSRSSVSPRVGETITAKGIPATDIKVSAAKTFLLNPKSGQKMVVVPARARTKQGPDGQPLPLIHFKGMPSAMRLLPVTAPAPAAAAAAARPSPVTVVAGKGSGANTIPPNAKVVSVEPIKTANMADIVPVKGLTPLSTPKSSKPLVRPASAKGNVIVVQKSATIGKALSFTKNGNDMSKIIMGKNVNQLLQAKQEQTDAKGTGNVIVLELNNDQAARTTTMSEILDSRVTNPARVSDPDKKETTGKITEETPVLFDTHITDETCNASSLDSTAESIGDIAPIESAIPRIVKEDTKANFSKDQEGAKDSSSVTDWEMELETVTRKGKDDDKLNSLHLDLGMSSDSDSDYIGESQKPKSKHTTSMAATIPLGVPSSQVIYETASGLSHATRTLLSQLQDEGSSSNDSSFALKSKEKAKDDTKCDHSLESEALNKAKEKLTEKVAKSQLKRIDIYSTAISSSDINLDAFSYLDEGMMAGDEEPRRAGPSLDDQLRRLLADDSQASTDSQTVSDSSPTTKQ